MQISAYVIIHCLLKRKRGRRRFPDYIVLEHDTYGNVMSHHTVGKLGSPIAELDRLAEGLTKLFGILRLTMVTGVAITFIVRGSCNTSNLLTLLTRLVDLIG